MATRNLYLVLGVPATASGSEIHDAYRRRAKERHPDLAGADSTQAFQDLAEAYAVLSDPGQRRRHDAALARDRDRRLAPGHPRARSSALEALLAALGAAGRSPSPGRGAPAHLEVELGREQAARGCRIAMPLRLRVACPGCGGSAVWRAACPICSGAGLVEQARIEDFEIPEGTRDGTWLEYRIETGTADRGLDVDQPDHVLIRLRVAVRS
jgi:molecular chaperone DnaJ